MWFKNLTRPFRSHASFTWATLIILGICFGACLAVVSVFQSAFFSHSPYADTDELYWLRSSKRSQRINPDLGRRIYEEGEIFDEFGCYSQPFRSKVERDTDRYCDVRFSLVIGDIFEVLGVEAAIGRGFQEADRQVGSETTGLISHEFFSREFGGDTGIIGKLFMMNGHPLRIIGVLPKNFDGPSSTNTYDIYIPVAHYAAFVSKYFLLNKNWHSMTGIGRIKSGSKAELTAKLDAFFKAYIASVPDKGLIEPRLFTYTEDTFHQRRDLKQLYLLIGGVVAALFLIALTNALTFVSLRTSWRSNDVLIRIALGASRQRMLLHHSVEAGLFSIVSSGIGLLVGCAIFHLVRVFFAGLSPGASSGFLTLEVLALSGLACLLMLVVFALIPSLWMRCLSLSNVVKGNRTVSIKSRALPVFAGIQVAVSTILVVFCFLFVKSSMRAVSVDPGYAYENIITVYCDTSHLSEDRAERIAMHDEVVSSISSLPEVEMATRGWMNFLSEMGTDPLLYEHEGTSDIKEEHKLIRRYTGGEGFFELMGIPITKGRGFELGDRSRDDQVVVVNQALLDQYFPGEDPLAVRFRTLSGDGPLYHVIGVMPNFMITRGIPENPAAVFNAAQFEFSGYGVIARARTDGATAKRAVEMHLRKQFQRLGSPRILTGDELYQESVEELKVAAIFLSFFGLQAILLTVIGLVIIFSFSAELWKRDLAIRMALGASSRQIIQFVCLRFAMVCLAGLAAGLAIVAAAAPQAADSLYNVSPWDPSVLAISILLVSVVGLLVSFGSSLRTLRIQPAREVL